MPLVVGQSGGEIGHGLEEVLRAGAAEVGAENTNERLLTVVLTLLDQSVRTRPVQYTIVCLSPRIGGARTRPLRA
eukprot:1183046-Prorocentrum_minimum.AAC.1